jgi:hypothetical protein
MPRIMKIAWCTMERCTTLVILQKITLASSHLGSLFRSSVSGSYSNFIFKYSTQKRFRWETSYSQPFIPTEDFHQCWNTQQPVSVPTLWPSLSRSRRPSCPTSTVHGHLGGLVWYSFHDRGSHPWQIFGNTPGIQTMAVSYFGFLQAGSVFTGQTQLCCQVCSVRMLIHGSDVRLVENFQK